MRHREFKEKLNHLLLNMKQVLLLTLLITILSSVAQNKKTAFPFDEFSISANQTDIATKYAKNRYGFGFGLYHTGLKNYMINLKTGIELNQTNQFHDNGPYRNRSNFAENVTYHIIAAAVPFTARLNLGKKTSFFLETGIYPEFNFASRMTGTLI